MEDHCTFFLHDRSRVRGRLPSNMRTLIEGLASRSNIKAVDDEMILRHLSSKGPQWLECQTSGSSGRPKVIRRMAQSWVRSFELHKSLFYLEPKDRYAVFGSLGHSLSLFAVLEALHVGATLSVLKRLRPTAQWRSLHADMATVVYATPTQLKRLQLGRNEELEPNLPSVRLVFVGGGKLSGKDRSDLVEVFPCAQIREFYGTSETSFISMTTPETPAGSVGKLYPGVELKVDELADGKGGSLHVKSPYLASFYVRQELRPIADETGYVSTGEIGHLDRDGFLYLKGRQDRMFTISDRNVFPEAIEEAVSQLEDVAVSVVIPIKDTLRGQRIVCFVEPMNKPCDPSAIRKRCRDVLGTAQVPHDVRFLQRIPLLPSGKPDVQRLIMRAKEDA